MAAINAEGLVKVFPSRSGEVRALDGVDLEVPTGSVLGLLGPNGAGKTTAVRILTTLLTPDAGRATVNGIDVATDPQGVRRSIGLSGQYAAVDEYLTGRENLVMVGRLYHFDMAQSRTRATELLEQFDLVEAADRPAKTYSGGMRRRLDLAGALVARPPIIFLDEPTTGLDPRSRIGLWEVIEGLVAQGTTVLLTTQYLDEADKLADSIAVVDRGRVIARGTSDELKAQVGGERLAVTVAAGQVWDAREVLAGLANGVIDVDEHSRQLVAPVAGGATALLEAVRAFDEKGVDILDIGIRRPTLDDVFLSSPGAMRRTTRPPLPRPRPRWRPRDSAHVDRRRPTERRHEGGDQPMSALGQTLSDTAHHHVAQRHAPASSAGLDRLRDHPVDHVRAAVRVRLRRRDRGSRRWGLHRLPHGRNLRADRGLHLRHDLHRHGRRSVPGAVRPVPLPADGQVRGSRGADLRRPRVRWGHHGGHGPHRAPRGLAD